MGINNLRQTHTYAELDVTPRTYDEIAGKLQAAGYDHAFMDGDAIDMHGIGIVCEPALVPGHETVADTWTITVRNKFGERLYFAFRLLFAWIEPEPVTKTKAPWPTR